MKETTPLIGMLWIAWFVFSGALNAQGVYAPTGHDTYFFLDRLDMQYSKQLPQLFTGIKPISRKVIGEYTQEYQNQNLRLNPRESWQLSWLMNDNSEWIPDTLIQSRERIWKFYPEPAHLFSLRKPNFILQINPVIYLHAGFERDARAGWLFHNTRGGEVRGYIKKRLGFYAFITENQARVPYFIAGYIFDQQAIPGEGYWKPFRNLGIDYFTARGYITFNLLDHIDFQLGHDKHFWGHGERSLFLSDFSQNMFFLKIQTRIWRFQYTNLFTELTGDYFRDSDRLLDKKYGVFHHLTYQFSPGFQVGVFEGIVYSRRNQLELQYLNPIIFYRAIEQALGSPDNAVVGLDAKANFLGTASIYGQVLIDEFNLGQIRARDKWWANKFAYQIGLKYTNAFSVPMLDLQAEFNTVRPYVYTANTGASNFTHYNQPLAHPLGANFREWLIIGRYQPWKWIQMTVKSGFAITGLDSTRQNWGADIFKPTADPAGRLDVEREFGNVIGQGFKTRIFWFSSLNTIQVRHNLNFDIHLMARNFKTKLPEKSRLDLFGTVGFRWNFAFRHPLF